MFPWMCGSRRPTRATLACRIQSRRRPAARPAPWLDTTGGVLHGRGTAVKTASGPSYPRSHSRPAAIILLHIPAARVLEGHGRRGAAAGVVQGGGPIIRPAACAPRRQRVARRRPGRLRRDGARRRQERGPVASPPATCEAETDQPASIKILIARVSTLTKTK